MKKSTPALAAVLLLAMNSHAQESTTPASASGEPFRLGIEACPTLSWLTSDEKDYENDGNLLGFRFGLLTDFRMGNDRYYFSTGLFLNNTGAKSVQEFTDSTGTTDLKSQLKMQYVEIPITIKLKTAEIGYMTYFGQLGFETGFRVSAKAIIDDGDKIDVMDQTNLLRVALVVGGGLEYNFSGNTSAIVGLKYSNAFTSVNDTDGPDARLHYFEITVGALF